MQPTEARARRWYLIWKTAGPLLILSGYLVLALAMGESQRASEIGSIIAALVLGGVICRATFVLLRFLEQHGRFAHYLRWALSGNLGGGAIVALFATVLWQEPKPGQPDVHAILHDPFVIGFLVSLATIGAYVSARLWEDDDRWHPPDLEQLDALLSRAEELYKADPDAADQLLYDHFVENGAAAEQRALLRRDAPSDLTAAIKLRHLLAQDLRLNARVRARAARSIPKPRRPDVLRNIDETAQHIRTELTQLDAIMRQLKAR